MKFILFSSLFLLNFDCYAFCGFYVGKTEAKLFNKASQVVMVRDGKRTVISMMNDYKGELSDFAMIIPVPQILKKKQVRLGYTSLFSRIDSFTAPRLVEYFDEDPCYNDRYDDRDSVLRRSRSRRDRDYESAEEALGVTVEEEYSLGEYDIVILSAKESKGLETWLKQNKYSIPEGASQALAPYIKQKMNFLVAKVNLKEQAKTGLNYLRPLQFAFESKKFMLPIRLGMLNSDGPQEIILHILTKKGRVEAVNYPTLKVPSNKELPLFVKEEFSEFYKAMFNKQVEKEKMKTVWTEYFWDMEWCDPCAAEPLSSEELRGLGVFWIDTEEESEDRPRGREQPVKVTRLHIRYSKETFPEDLMFYETEDTENFQARYILRHPWEGYPGQCDETENYFRELYDRQNKEVVHLSHLTGWDKDDILERVDFKLEELSFIREKPRAWWEKLWESLN